MTSSTVIEFQVAAGVATISLDSPHNRNALSHALRTQLAEALDRAVSDENVRIVVLTHNGSVFCSGADLKEAAERRPDPSAVPSLSALVERLWYSPKPVVGRVTGATRAGGIGLVAACDLVIASSNATFAFSEVRLGVIPAVISVPVLQRIPRWAALELFLTGETFSAHRAADLGLVNRAVGAESVDAEVARYVGMLVRGGPNALEGAKRLLRTDKQDEARATDLAQMAALSQAFFASEEAAEGIHAFAEKRSPAWVTET